MVPIYSPVAPAQPWIGELPEVWDEEAAVCGHPPFPGSGTGAGLLFLSSRILLQEDVAIHAQDGLVAALLAMTGCLSFEGEGLP